MTPRAAIPVKASRLGQPAYVGALPRVTASMIAAHGSYEAARAALAAPEAASSGSTEPEALNSHFAAVEAGGDNGEG